VYELLAGRKVFANEAATGTIESILKQEPDWTLLPKQTPSALVRLLHQCLEKDRARRPQSAKDLRRMIEEIQTARQRKNWVLKAAIGTIVVLAGFILFSTRYLPKTGDLRVAETQQITMAPELEIDPALSPDGKWLAYCGGPIDSMDIYVRKISDGTVINLTRGKGSPYNRWPRWSPDGKLLAYVSDRRMLSKMAVYENGHSIFIIPPTGGMPHFVTIADSLGLAWSPDGKKLAYLRNNGLHMILLKSGVSKKIADSSGYHSPAWSPDGKWIAVVSGNQESLFVPFALGNMAGSGIVLLDATTGERHPLTDTSMSNSSPVWMPDSGSILFLSNRGGSRDVFELEISSTGKAVGEPHRITVGLDALIIDASANGKQIAYAKFLLKSNLASIPIPREGTVSSSKATFLTEGTQSIEGVNISRDGKWIVYDSNPRGNQDIYKIPRAGGPAVQLTHTPQDDFAPNWSPDGRFIAFHSFRNGNRDIYVMSADGSDLQQVTNDPAQERFPDWAPDGKSIVFYSDKSGQQEIYRVSQENGKWGIPVRLTFTETGAMNPRWSPDGKAIAYGDLLKGLSLISPDGKNAQILVARQDDLWPQYLAWSGDSKTIYFRAADERRFWSIFSVPASGGTPRKLVRFEDFSRFDLATDDKDFFFTLPERESDIWMLRLER
jgi:Tol biopolymer transport system component